MLDDILATIERLQPGLFLAFCLLVAYLIGGWAIVGWFILGAVIGYLIG